MKNTFIVIVVFSLGFLVVNQCNRSNESTNEGGQLIYNGLAQLSKLQVTEGYVTEVYTYANSKSYFGDLITFDKKALVVVNAKIQIAYNLKELDIRVDSVQKKINIKAVPKPEVTIVPTMKYYDLEQSAFNEFTAKDYNTISDKAIEIVEQHKIVGDLKKQAHDHLFEELSKLLVLSSHFNWEVVDETNSIYFKLKD